MKRFYFSNLLIVIAILLGSDFGAKAQTTTYSTPGGPYYYTVGPGVTAISVDMSGAQGGSSISSPGGKGGRMQAAITVTTGQVFAVYVGGTGANYSYCVSTAGGLNGGGSGYGYGGGGGGASDIRSGGIALTNRILVAAGGGGGGYDCGTSGGENGGDGGGTTGGNGNYCGTTSTCVCGSGATLTGGGAGASCYGSPSGGLGAGANASSSYCYAGGGGGGYYGGGAGAYGGGGGGSSFPASGTTTGGLSGVINTSAYNSGVGSVAICAPNLGAIVGSSTVCVGTTTALSISGSGGTWSSSNPTAATISTSGVVSGLAAGVTVITYNSAIGACGAGFVTTTVTVNPTPSAIASVPGVCLGSTITLTDATGGGTWSSTNLTRATIGSTTGAITGLSLGSTTVSYTLTATGCFSTMNVNVNPLPSTITGAAAVCGGGSYTTTYSDVTPGGSWSSSSLSNATVDPTFGVITGGAPGSSNIIYTLPTGCSVSKTISINPLPTAITGTATACAGASTTLSDAGGGSWSSSNIAIASVGATSGVVSGVTAGTANISYTLPTGCAISTPVFINAAPAAITGVTNACVGGTTGLTDITTGGVWASSNTALAVINPASGVVTGVSAGIPTVTYTISSTGCYVTTPVVIDPLPAVYAITGGGGYCAGGTANHIGLVYSASGINYKLYSGGVQVGSTVTGSNSGLDFGVFPTTGTYTAIGIDATYGCTSSMAGSTVVSISTPPTPYAVGGGGSFCPGGAGVPVTLSSSDTGNQYQLYFAGSAIGSPFSGTGGTIIFGTYTGVGNYTAVATNGSTGCSQNMTGHATVANYPLPTTYSMNTGGSFCAGGAGVHVTLSGSDASTSYQLYNGLSTAGSPVTGSGSFIDFGAITTPGNYTVIATNPSTTCTQNMSGTSVVAVNPLPTTYTVTGGGSYCAGTTGVHVGLNYSNTGISYQLYNGTAPIGSPVAGTSAGLDFGTQTTLGRYTVVATSSLGCTGNMTGSATVNTTPAPAIHNVTGTGSYCAGGAGVHVGLDGSNPGIRYQVMTGGSPSGASVSGTGSALDFGLRATAGGYSVVATDATTSCTSNMTGTATVVVNPVPVAYTVNASGSSYCLGGSGIDVQLSGSVTGVSYQLFNGGAPVGVALAGTGSPIDFGSMTTAGTYTVKGTIPVTGCATNMAGSAPVSITSLPFAYALTGGGSFCSGGTGVHVGLTGSNIGVNYQLFDSPGGPSGLPVAGTGGAIDFGFEAASGSYTVVATDGTTSCSSNMTGVSTVNVNTPPNAYGITGGGAYCAGTGGVPVGLAGSDNGGVMYQLYNGTTPVGSAVAGTGSTLSFGNQSATGTYSIVANNPSTGCSTNMTTPVMVSITTLPASHNVTGGGVYCSGGAGLPVELDGSDTGVSYQVFYGGSPLGGSVIGTGTPLSFGTEPGAGVYTVVASSSSTGCIGTMAGSATITINPQPTVDTMTGGGGYCAGGTGVHVGMNSSSTGINYQLYNGLSAVGSVMPGTGSALDFGSLTGGSYTVVASPGGVCATTMAGVATVTVSPLPSVFAVTGGGSYCANASGLTVGLSSSQSGVNYQLYNGTTAVGTATPGTGSAITFGMESASGAYTVVATDATTGCTSNMSGGGLIAVTILPAPTAYDVTGGGAYCAGGSGVSVTLSHSNTNINYQLYANGTATGSLMPGTGTFIDFGLETTAGSYTVVATDAATGCQNNMNDAAEVSINPILTPVVTVVSLSGNSIFINHTDTLMANATNIGTGATYQWFINGFIVPGATTNTLVENNFNNHDVVSCTVTSGGTCGGVASTNEVTLTVINNVGVQQVASTDANVTVVPNPNKGTFAVTGTLGTNSNEEISLQLVDVLGHVVYTGKTTANNGVINEKVHISNTLANGMYILNMNSATMNKVLHVVIAQ